MRTVHVDLTCVVALFAAFVPAIPAAAVLPPFDTSQTTSVSPAASFNLTLSGTSLGAIDPRRFSASSQYGSQTLPATAVLMNIIDLMTQLALQDWQSDIGPKTCRMNDARYSQIEIYIGPSSSRPRATLKCGYAVLGLFEVIANILTDPKNRFKSVQSIFSYDRREVASFVMRAVPSVSVSPSSIDSGNLRTPIISAPAWSDPHLTLETTQNLAILTIYEIFFACAATLRELAPNPISQQVREVSLDINAPPITKAGSPMIVSFQNIGRTPRTPPFFKWEWAIKVVARLPVTMLESRNFKGVSEMVVVVDRVHVGLGFFARKPGGTAVQ